MPRTETLIASKMRKAGINTNEYLLRQIAHEVLTKTHGNVQRGLAPFAKQLSEQLDVLAFALAPVLDRFAKEMSGHVMDEAQVSFAAQANGPGQRKPAPQAIRAQPVREPSAAQRAASAAVAAKISILDTYKVWDGRGIGDVNYGEAERFRNRSAMDASIWRQIQRAHPNAPHDMKIRDIVKTDEFQRMLQRAAEVADAA